MEGEYFVGVRGRGLSVKVISKLVSGILFVLVFNPISMAAQSTGQANSGQVSGGVFTIGQAEGATTVTAAHGPNPCPVSLRAQHQADGSLVKIRGDHPAGVGQGLHLTLVNPPSRQIATATMTIRGWSNKARITQTGAGNGSGGGAFDTIKTVTVQFSAAAPGTVAGDVRVPGMTAVERIDLDSVVYTDGTVESFAAEQACHVTPDPFMLVAGR